MRRARVTPSLGLLLTVLCGFPFAAFLASIPDPAPRECAGARPPDWARTGKRPALRPNDWFHLQRAFPGREIDPEARREAVAAAGRLHARGGAATGGSLWAGAGPNNVGGRITALTAAPVGATLFVGAAAGGVFRSTDSGGSWTPVFDSAGVYSIGALARDAGGVIWVGTGEANSSGDSFAGEGVFRSTDLGETWVSRGLEATRHIGRIAIDPTDPDRVFVAAMGALFSKGADRGVYRTTDGGGSWDRVLFVDDSTGVIDVAIDPSNPDRVYAASWTRIRRPHHRRVGGLGSGIHRSTDGGDTWQLLAGGLPIPSATRGRIGIAIAPSNPLVLYAIYADDPGNFAGLYRSTDAGTSWTRTNDGALSSMYAGFGWYFGNVRVHPTDPNRVFALGLDLYRSTNGGSSWSAVSGDVHVDHHDLWIDPTNGQRVLLGCDGGLYRSVTGGSAWTFLSGLPISQFYAGTIDESAPERIYGGLQDNGTVRTLTGALDDWDFIYGGDGFYTLVDPRDSDVIFAEYQYGGLGKSIDGGASFLGATSGIDSGDRRNWMTPVVFDPLNPDRMYYGTYRLYRTTNGAASWSLVSGDLTGPSIGGSLPYRTITTIAVAPADPARIYVGTDDARVWTTSNSGGVWTNVSAGLPSRWVTRVEVDPFDPLVAYVAHSGYRQDDPAAHLHRTSDAGVSWTPIDGGLPDAPINDAVVDPGDSSTLYVASDVGVFVTHDLGGAWDVLAGGMPVQPVFDLTLHAPTRSLVAFTHGRSTYRVVLPEPTGVGDDLPPPGVARVTLAPVSPNPCSLSGHGVLQISGAARAGETIDLSLVDVSGRRVRALTPSLDTGGSFRGSLDARVGGLSPGVYWVRAAVAGGTDVRRVVLLP